MTLSDQELDIVARTVWGEARSEGLAGMVAVGHVVRNRVESPVVWWGKSPIAVCLRKYQFSCWNKTDPNYAYLAGEKSISDTAMQLCRVSALKAFQDTLDPTGGATHYYATSIEAPSWVDGATFTCQIGRHRFYKDVP